jgi:hypothetical protein
VTGALKVVVADPASTSEPEVARDAEAFAVVKGLAAVGEVPAVTGVLAEAAATLTVAVAPDAAAVFLVAAVAAVARVAVLAEVDSVIGMRAF